MAEAPGPARLTRRIANHPREMAVPLVPRFRGVAWA